MTYSLTYGLVLFCTVVVCFVFSFHSKIRFYRHFGAFLRSSITVAIPFILWDSWFTSRGVWWFNERYTLGWHIAHLPIEEWLFFIAIPFSCTFTYYCLNKLCKPIRNIKNNTLLSAILAIGSIAIALIFYHQMYTALTFALLGISLCVLLFVLKAPWLTKSMVVYTVLMLGFLPVNGILTGTGLPSPVVTYNPNAIWNSRIGTIPLEDIFYGYLLIVWNLYFFQKWHLKNN